ncbi:MAG TPA: helix-turn-helix domain-containing protein, partial [Acidimicrobiales bacterium]|nr:helix-turn-helix domain-containing protein [Acidimicrobiales bacterium]
MTTNADDRLLLTVDEACESLHVSRPIVYQLLNSGRLRSIKIGTARRIPVESLRAYIQDALDSQGP